MIFKEEHLVAPIMLSIAATIYFTDFTSRSSLELDIGDAALDEQQNIRNYYSLAQSESKTFHDNQLAMKWEYNGKSGLLDLTEEHYMPAITKYKYPKDSLGYTIVMINLSLHGEDSDVLLPNAEIDVDNIKGSISNYMK